MLTSDLWAFLAPPSAHSSPSGKMKDALPQDKSTSCATCILFFYPSVLLIGQRRDVRGPLSVIQSGWEREKEIKPVCLFSCLCNRHLPLTHSESKTMTSIITHLLARESKTPKCTWQHVVTQIHQQVTWTLLETTWMVRLCMLLWPDIALSTGHSVTHVARRGREWERAREAKPSSPPTQLIRKAIETCSLLYTQKGPAGHLNRN